MYYPYLRGRQFELIALREFADHLTDDCYITPIIEPIRSSFSSMKLAFPKLNNGNVKLALILNPLVGELKERPDAVTIITDTLQDELEDMSTWIPVFNLTNNFNEVTGYINDLGFEDVMLMCTDNVDTSNSEFIRLVNSSPVKFILSNENRTLKRMLSDSGKELIRLDDNFKGQKRNSDYLPLTEEKFTEEHLFYKEDGYFGFADYTPLVSDFSEGGRTPYAVAIHLTYQKANKEVWVRHFTSETNDDDSNIQGKFAEAAAKAVRFLNDENIQTAAANELKRYFSVERYPGLGTVKKIAIKNHIELLNNVMVNQREL